MKRTYGKCTFSAFIYTPACKCKMNLREFAMTSKKKLQK